MKNTKYIQEVECPEPVEGQYFVYFVQCTDYSLYCGYTNNLKLRINRHNAGEAAKYTRSRKPVRLVYYEVYKSRLDAMRRERQLKGWVTKKKVALINQAGIV